MHIQIEAVWYENLGSSSFQKKLRYALIAYQSIKELPPSGTFIKLIAVIAPS